MIRPGAINSAKFTSLIWLTDLPKASENTVAKLQVLNRDELLKLGYFKVVLDEEAVEEALLSADRRPEVEEYADMKIETVSKKSTIRINKRKSLSQDDTQIAA